MARATFSTLPPEILSIVVYHAARTPAPTDLVTTRMRLASPFHTLPLNFFNFTAATKELTSWDAAEHEGWKRTGHQTLLSLARVCKATWAASQPLLAASAAVRRPVSKERQARLLSTAAHMKSLFVDSPKPVLRDLSIFLAQSVALSDLAFADETSSMLPKILENLPAQHRQLRGLRLILSMSAIRALQTLHLCGGLVSLVVLEDGNDFELPQSLAEEVAAAIWQLRCLEDLEILVSWQDVSHLAKNVACFLKTSPWHPPLKRLVLQTWEGLSLGVAISWAASASRTLEMFVFHAYHIGSATPARDSTEQPGQQTRRLIEDGVALKSAFPHLSFVDVEDGQYLDRRDPARTYEPFSPAWSLLSRSPKLQYFTIRGSMQMDYTNAVILVSYLTHPPPPVRQFTIDLPAPEASREYLLRMLKEQWVATTVVCDCTFLAIENERAHW